MAIGSGLAAQLGIADEVYTNEVQEVETTGTPSGGTFTLVFDGCETAPIAYDANAAAIKAALEALPNIDTVTVTGGALPTTVEITFSGPLVAGRDVPTLELGDNSLSGGSDPSVSISVATPGKGYGDYVTPDRFLEFVDESLQLEVQRNESAGLRASNTVLRSDRWYAGQRNVTGAVTLEVPTKGFGRVLRQILGGVAVTTPQGATTSRDHTGTLADLWNRSMVIQVGTPDTGGVVRPRTYLGCKVATATFRNSVDGLLEVELDIDGQDETLGQALAAASYASGFKQLSWVGGTLRIGGALVEVNDIEIVIANALRVDRHFLGRGGLKKQPIHNALREITGTITCEWTDTTLYERYVDGEPAELVALWEGDPIESGFNYGLQITIPVARFDGTTPNVSGPDVVPLTMPIKALNNGTDEPITIVYRTTDTSV